MDLLDLYVYSGIQKNAKSQLLKALFPKYLDIKNDS